MTQLPRPALCQVNYDRDLPASTRLQVSNNHHQQQPTRPRHSPIPCITCKQKGEQLGKTLHDKRTPYRYSLPPPKSASHPPDSDFISFLSRRERPFDHHHAARARTAGTAAYSLPVLPSRVGVQTSLTMNAERLKEPTWNHCLNAWVSSTRCHQAYVSIAGPSNLNNRDIFHFVREFDEIRRSPCERFEGHKHHHRAPKQIQKRSKKTLEKPEFWHWRGRTEPVIRRFSKVKMCLPAGSNSSSSKSCMCAFSTRGRISITLPVPSPSSSPDSYADSCRSDTCAPDFSPHSFLSELSSLSPFSSTFNPVSPSESRVSANSVTTTTSGIVSCDSFPSTTVPKTTNLKISFYLICVPKQFQFQ
ncbi:uncharacterized protein [Antedon mediterranea]|uniref:uncharacterized protein n=1 Tax=Antedon mediterranea TaxID=105859 RepID=UPI003AF5450A